MIDEVAASERVSVGFLEEGDQEEFLAAVEQSLELHAHWVFPPRTSEQFAEMLARLAEPQNRGFVIRHRASGDLVGLINITNIVMGRLRSANLGYYAFAASAGKGLMKEALSIVCRYGFDVLGLHRLEAGIQPGNHRSIRLVQSAGFRYEGLSLRYLWIDDMWRDHERWAITVEDLG